MLVAAVILALLAIPLFALGLRGRIIDDHPVCRKCKFDLVGVYPGHPLCPECGRDQKRNPPRTGNRRKRWRVVLAACASLALAATFVGVHTWRVIDEDGWVRHAPVFVLKREVLSPAASRTDIAFRELLRRVEEDGLNPKRLTSTIEGVLARQRDADVVWNPAWGQFVEDARPLQAVSDEQWGRYAHGIIFDATLVPNTPVRLGDAVPFKIDFALRCSPTPLFPVVFRVMPASVNGVRAQVKVRAGDPWSVAHPGSRSFGYDSVWMGIPPSLSVTAPDRDPSSPNAWPAARDRGEGIQSVQVHAYVFENPNHPWRIQRMRDLVPEVAIANRTFDIEAPFTVVAADASTVSLVTDPARAPDLSHRSTLVRQQRDGRWRCQGQINVPSTPTGIAFDVFWRAGGREWPLGSITSTQGGSGTQWHYYYGTFDNFDPVTYPTVDVILRPSEAAARRVPGMTAIWGAEIILKDVPIEGPEISEPDINKDGSTGGGGGGGGGA
jgi:hypothetical protein